MNGSAAVRPSRCLITGASGFIGSRLCERYAGMNGQSFVAMTRNPQAGAALRAQGMEVALADLGDPSAIDKALAGCDAIVHLAHGGDGVNATRNLVSAAARARVARFIHISTMSVHGPTPGADARCEDTATIGRYGNDYCDSKAEQEEIVQAAIDRGDLSAVILRPTVVYGPRSHFVNQIVEQARRGVVTLFDQGTGLCNAVYVDDVCDAIDASLLSREAIGRAMFINGDQPIQWGEFIRAFAGLVEPPARIENLSAADAIAYWTAHSPGRQPGLLGRIAKKVASLAGKEAVPAPWPPLGRVQREMIAIAFSNALAKQLLGWSPKVDFTEGVRLTRRWFEGGSRA